MESLRNVATAAATYVGLVPENESETGSGHIAGGEAAQNTEHMLSNTQSGVEPVSGKLGYGKGGEPYDAGNEQGASALDGSSAYKSTSTYGSQQPTRGQGDLTSGSASNQHSTPRVGSEPLSRKVEAVFGVGGSSGESHLGGGNSGPGFGQSSKLGSTAAHGSNPERHLYNAKNAPGLGGHRLDDDFTSSNIRHEGANSLPSEKGSDAAAGHSTSSGGLTGNRGIASDSSRSGTSSSSGVGSGVAAGLGKSSGETGRTSTTNTSIGTTSGLGETVARKVDEYTPGTTGTRQTGQGHNNANTRGFESTAPLNTSGSTGERGIAGAGLGGAAASQYRSADNAPGYDAEPTAHGGARVISDDMDGGCIEEREGYLPHGGHPIGEAAHSTDDGKATFLDYRNDTKLPMGRARPADK